jgi:hypothetical protein
MLKSTNPMARTAKQQQQNKRATQPVKPAGKPFAHVRILRSEPGAGEEALGMFLDEEEITLLYCALKAYKPATENERWRYDLLLEELEEIVLIDLGSPDFDVN